MLENLSPAVGSAIIALTATFLFAVFWRSTKGANAVDTIFIRTMLGVLLLPFVVAGILGALGRTGDAPQSAPRSPPPIAKGAGEPAPGNAPAMPTRTAAPAPTAASRPEAAVQAPAPAAPAPAAPAAPAPEAATPRSPPPASVAAPAPAPPPIILPPTTSEPWDVVPVYFGTDRKTQGLSERPEFGSERARRLDLGRAFVTVPKVHEVPNVERPWVYRLPFTRYVIYEEKEDPARHFTLKEVKVMSREDLARLVRDRLGASRDFKDHALLFVHGFNTTFEAALFRTAQIAYDLKFDGAPFLYSWPSKGQIGFQDYSYDRESAGQAEPYLREMLEFVTKETGAKTVSIIAHSMGNQVLLPVLRDLKRTSPPGVTIAQIILAAPDVDRDTFEFLAKEISGVGQGITMLAASNDRALTASRRFWGGVPRAGDVPDDGPVVVPGIDTIDVTAVSTEMMSLNHSGYAQKQQLLEDIGRLMKTGTRPPDKRMETLQRVPTPKGDFWRYPATP